MYEPAYLNDSYDRFETDDSFNIAVSTTDANSLHEINNIRTRENRMFKKLKELQSTQSAPNKDCTSCCDTNICGVRGNQKVNARNNIKNNIEDYSMNNLDETRISEAFGQKKNDIDFLQNEINIMDKKNSNLIIFIFLLVIIVLIQFAKSSNDPVKVYMMHVPKGNPVPIDSN
jgi:hypothetical protein